MNDIEVTESEGMSAPIFLDAEEIKHVNLAMKSYRRGVEILFHDAERRGVTEIRDRQLALIDGIIAELQSGNDKL